MKPRYLTKSRFKLALECPTKLYYDGKTEYANQNIEDPFLEALADGGFQVGELAKKYFPGGCEIKTLDYDEALHQTNELLKQENATIYEAAILFNNLFVRVDILRKNENKIELVEVKAKSFDAAKDSFLNANGEIVTKWFPYLSDIAFQKYVAMNSFPNHEISAYLMMADKNASCPTNGLNQKFKVAKDANGRKKVVVTQQLSAEDLAEQILLQVNVDEPCAAIYSNGFEDVSFGEYVALLADHYQRDEKIGWPLSATCAKCQYRTNKQEKTLGLKSGFEECWREKLNWTDNDFLEPNVIEIWSFRKKNQYIKEGRIKLSEIAEEDISPKADKKPGLSPTQRQWLQVQKVQCQDTTCWIDSENLRREMSGWIYPLHFIDFETSSVAIPFNKGRRPYEGIAFQFSHHVIYEDGQIEHRGQYLNVEPGKFPNYEFIRSLKAELEYDNGSIFRYAAHENTYLNLIYKQLMEDQEEIPDRETLCHFIRTITQSVGGSEAQWNGVRNMIDMCELVKRYYYSPAMKGSNSIKQVLPSILNSSRFLQEKYSKPIYGAQGGITSLNYNNWKWIEFVDDRVKDPYKLLPKMFQDVSEKDFELLSDSEDLNNGGAALTAYARLQFEEMTDYERKEIHQALLKYCELDTLAMVMIYEAWKDMIFPLEHSGEDRLS
ncbi:hypothetical protein AXX12_12535 [Anaerosporomusa subterranea]|uniref:DUF2779 domain-containing protein n=1 Tax=Anaerosporomusa subterranea TaxID=1794912 RepID=A0A154BNI2_ANASB|nr:DUF2779 domain-containing protein [Anaerosporomusa subterranea]KYZ75534.1 hypothetical protein AXX12_12535 [Anaerosporomusa subterranea]